ncbi:hypothetical protein AAG906_035101 [Vitis piasezkii]
MCYGSRHNQGVAYPGTAGVAPDILNERPGERPLPTYHIPQDESSDSTSVSSKRQRDKRPQLSDAMRDRPPTTATWETSRIINYDPPRGFLVSKFSAYNGSSDPFDHIIHYRQLMTLDIGNDALLCKIFPAILQGQALSSPGRRQGEQSHPELPSLTPLTVSYEKLLLMIRELSDFSLHYLVERLIKAGHLKQYIRLEARGMETSWSRTSRTLKALIVPRAVINYIHGGPLDEERILVDPDSSTNLFSLLEPKETQNIKEALQQNQDVFAWTHSDMPIIHPLVGSHQLNILPSSRPVRQKVRRFHLDRQKIIRDEVDKLLDVGFIRKVEYPEWLANVVVVPKKERKWRVCMDYTNLNNACPKDNFPLPRIDQIVNSTTGQGMISFLDAFSGCHQIPMAPADEEKTAFITPHGLYCYKVMPFRLKNVDATYQRLMTKIFRPLVGRTVEVYIDDIVVKSKIREDHTHHLQEVFHLLRRYDMKLNPSKCAFGISAGKLLGFMVTYRGIEVSLEQIKNLPNNLLEMGNWTRRSGGPYKSTEPLDPIRLGFLASSNEADQRRAHDAILDKSEGHPATVGRTNPSITEAPACNAIEESQEWTGVIKEYLRTGIRVQAACFALIRECLYKRSFTSPYLSLWPFAQWGMDIVGHLPVAAVQMKFLFVATDYFSKWVEAEAYASIKDKDVTKFVWKNIICRFEIPQSIIADNEATNKTLLIVLKKILDQAKGKWVEELPSVLWAYRTTPGRPAGNTPFALAYGMDAIIPTKIGLPTIWIAVRGRRDENQELKRNLDWADEVRENVAI